MSLVFGRRVFSWSSIILLAVASSDGRREGEVVQAELSSLLDPLIQSKNPLWANMDRARVFVILRERVGQVLKIIDFCGRVIRQVHDELFPLDEAPKKLSDLFRMFSQPDKVRRMVRQQMQAGAHCALAFVHLHWPGQT